MPLRTALAGVKVVRIQSTLNSNKDSFVMKSLLMSAVLISGLTLATAASASNQSGEVFIPGKPLQQQIERIEIELNDGEIAKGWAMFLALLDFWRAKNGYDPSLQPLAA